MVLAGELHAKHRGERERNKSGDQHCACHHYPKLAEQSANKTLQENNGQENNGQRDRGRNYCEENFSRPFFGCTIFVHATFQFLINIFGDHNAVIHHKACSQNNSQHRQYIDGETAQIHDEERGDK